MIVDIANNPRIVQVLGRIEELRRAASERPPSDPERARLDGEVASLYVDVGAYTHWLMRQDPQSLAMVEEEARRYALSLGRTTLPLAPGVDARPFSPDEWADTDLLGAADLHALDTGALAAVAADGSDEWDATSPDDAFIPDLEPLYADDQDDPDAERTDLTGMSRATSATSASLDSHLAAAPWDDGNLVTLDASDLIEAEPAGTPVRARVAPRTAEPIAVREREDAAADAQDPDDHIDWLAPLRELLDTVGAPERADDPAAQVACVAALSRATTNLEMRWVQYPDSVQQALLGYLGARARRLAVAAPADADIRLAIGRMERFMVARGLAGVPALRREPPIRDWRSDERRLWAILQAGL